MDSIQHWSIALGIASESIGDKSHSERQEYIKSVQVDCTTKDEEEVFYRRELITMFISSVINSTTEELRALTTTIAESILSEESK